MKKTLLTLLVILILNIQSHCFGQVYSVESLYANGVKNYQTGDWQYASVYLFSLIQKNPAAFSTEPTFKKEVITAFDFAMDQLRTQVANGKSYVLQNSKSKDGLGSSQSGLSRTPPPLRSTNSVKF